MQTNESLSMFLINSVRVVVLIVDVGTETSSLKLVAGEREEEDWGGNSLYRNPPMNVKGSTALVSIVVLILMQRAPAVSCFSPGPSRSLR